VRRVYAAAWLLLVLLLGACSSGPFEAADGPLHPIEPGAVADAIPRPDPVLRAGNTSPYRVNGEVYTVLPSSTGYRERGIASWYGRKFHGRKTANGEIFDAYAASAAHRSLPIPGYVRVTNLENYRSIVVRVNDRGPFHSDRIIDLSYGAAIKLGFAEQGTAPVEVVAIDIEGVEDLRADPNLTDWKSDYRYLQVGSFGEQASAHRLQRQLLAQLDAPVEVSQFSLRGNAWYRVRVGPVSDRQQLVALQQQLELLGYIHVKPMPAVE
jgi:rare lipoprotein A